MLLCGRNRLESFNATTSKKPAALRSAPWHLIIQLDAKRIFDVIMVNYAAPAALLIWRNNPPKTENTQNRFYRRFLSISEPNPTFVTR